MRSFDVSSSHTLACCLFGKSGSVASLHLVGPAETKLVRLFAAQFIDECLTLLHCTIVPGPSTLKRVRCPSRRVTKTKKSLLERKREMQLGVHIHVHDVTTGWTVRLFVPDFGRGIGARETVTHMTRQTRMMALVLYVTTRRGGGPVRQYANESTRHSPSTLASLSPLTRLISRTRHPTAAWARDR